jgi:glycosyltransferase involved in cell wall biosynthesis
MPDRLNAQSSPSVSVIIPTYNRAWCLSEAVDSVLAQDFSDFELIVVDDGSTDGTADLLAAYGNDIAVLQLEHSGVSAARNAGIATARGELIAFLDSDDIWLPKKLSTQVQFFNSHADALICQTEEMWVRNGRRVNPGKRHRKPSGMIFEPSLELCLVSPSAVMVRKGLFQHVGFFDESLPACEDYDMWLRVSCRIPVYLIDAPLIIKRGGHADQLSRTRGLDKHRIAAMTKLLQGDVLDIAQRRAAVRALKQKCDVYSSGCRKRARLAEAEHFERLAGLYRGDSDGSETSKA